MRLLLMGDQRMPLLVRSAKRLTSPTPTVLQPLCLNSVERKRSERPTWQSIDDWSSEPNEEIAKV